MTGTRALLHNVWRCFSSSVGNCRDKNTTMLTSARAFSQSSVAKKNDIVKKEVISRHAEDFKAPSPYKNPGPRRYGYSIKYKTQGCLPRDDKPLRSLSAYKSVNRWETKAALFGQNDYIDILGDGSIHPSDLLTGPPWLLGFKGNERERLLRKMEWQGNRLRLLYPAEYNRMQKRIRYLTKLYNTKRHIKGKD